MTEITLDVATQLIAASEDRADEVGVPMCIAVVDGGGNLVAFHRMDDALLASVSIAQNKAYSAVSLKMSTETVAELAQPGEALYGIGGTNDGRIVTFGGGIPLETDDGVVGAVGVSGGSPEEDVDVATAAVEAFDS